MPRQNSYQKTAIVTHGRSHGAVLGIETSCDETAAAVMDRHGRVLSNIVSSQHDVHRPFGGVVPELASRSHIQAIESVTCTALDRAGLRWSEIGSIAVTQGPGLAGALLVGLSYAKGLAYALDIPLIAVSHLEGHIASAWIDNPSFPSSCIVLVVSGGHTHLYRAASDGRYILLGKTWDDAAGEAFDKGAQMLGLDHPGGPALDRLARSGDPRRVHFPRSYAKRNGLDFSFSGLKTSLLYYLEDRKGRSTDKELADIAAGYQEAITEVLVNRAFQAIHESGVTALAVVGGVSANSRLRALFADRAAAEGIQLSLPALGYCTDNAAMIAAAGRRALMCGRVTALDCEAISDLELPVW